MKRVIEVHRVSKTFRVPSVQRETVREHVFARFRRRRWTDLRVLNEVSFAVERGETLGIMGRNGSGKSTLLKIVAGVYRPDAGSVSVSAPVTPVLELGLGWNPQLDAIDNIHLIGGLLGMPLGEIRRSIDGILAFAELERFAHLKLQHYSSGMAARLAYAVAFTAVRDMLILDEIFAVGDAQFQEKCKARYRELRADGHSVILVSHDPAIVSEFCDRALLLEGGRVAFEGTAAAVCAAYCASAREDTPAFALATGA